MKPGSTTVMGKQMRKGVLLLRQAGTLAGWCRVRARRTAIRSDQRSLAEAEQADGVVLEDLGADLWLDVEELEVAQPAFRGEQRVVGAEQHLVLQVGTGRADQLRREVLR